MTSEQYQQITDSAYLLGISVLNPESIPTTELEGLWKQYADQPLIWFSDVTQWVDDKLADGYKPNIIVPNNPQ